MWNTLVRLPAILRSWIAPNLNLFLSFKLPLIWLLAIIIGAVTAVAAIVFRLAIGLFQWPWLHTMGEHVASAAAEQPWWVVILAPTVGGAIVGYLLVRFQPGRRALGVADVIEARIKGARGLGLGPGLSSALITTISLGSGASAGREGPMVHLGATLGTAICGIFRLPDTSRKIILACGVASAVSASFNAPIAGVLFAHEVVLGHYAMSAFVPIVLSSTMGAIISRLWFGDVAAFVIPQYEITSYWEIPAFALLGLICAAVAICFQFAVISTDWAARNIEMPLWLRPIIGGLLVGSIAVFFPEVLGVGYETTDQALKHQLAIEVLLILLVVKTAATAITLASRFGGGVFTPSLYLGAMAGGAFGLIAASIFPDMASSHGLYAILGMGAVAAAVLGAPISTTMIVFELTGGYGLSIALLITVSIATGLTLAVHGRSFFQWQLESRGYIMQDGAHRWLVRTVHVSNFMRPIEDTEPSHIAPDDDCPRLRQSDTLEAALRLFDSAGEERLPVVSDTDEYQVVGWASHVHALSNFNKALIDANVEEHR
ncbi:MAG: chloride channel protein [Stappiaceae bacterium]